MNQNKYPDRLAMTVEWMHKDGSLPDTVAGVAKDPFVVNTLAATPPRELEEGLRNATQILIDSGHSRARRALADYDFDKAAEAADRVEATESPELAQAMREDAADARVDEEVAGIEHFNSSRASETPLFDPNQAVRVYNGREVLGSRVFRIWHRIGALAGLAAGVAASHALTGGSSPRAVGLGAAAAVAGGAIPRGFRERISERGAQWQARRLAGSRHDA